MDLLPGELSKITLGSVTALLAMAFLAGPFVLLVAGCNHTGSPSSGTVPVAMEARSTTAAASVAAAREVNRSQPESRTTEVVEKELEVAQANLPLPSQAQLTAAQNRAQAALVAERDQLSTLYASALDNAAKLQRDLDTAREQAGRRAAIEESRRAALMLQTRITSWAAVGFMALGAGIGFTGNVRIGVSCMVLGGILLASSRIIATVPDWAYTVLFITAGILILIARAFMWWAYRTGLFQKPPATVGEFPLQPN
jgi:hypothetical protein